MGKDLIWLATLVMFLLKLAAEYYSARYKWVQAVQQRQSRNQDSGLEQRMVEYLTRQECWGALFAFTLILLMLIFLTIHSDYIFPLLTCVTMSLFAVIGAIGAVGDRRRLFSDE